jgi:hypothetical protein
MACSKRLLIENIMGEIRRMAGETNTDGNLPDEMLLDTLNRASREAAMLLGRYHPEPLITYTTLTTTASEPELDIPEDCLEGRIQKVELLLSSSAPRELLRVSSADNHKFEEAPGTATYPDVWFEVGYTRKLRVLPQPMAGLTLRVWYVRDLPELAISQGKITNITNLLTSNYLLVDEVGDDLTSTLSEDGSHVSLIDGQTGLIKAIYEISNVNSTTGRVTFAASPSVTSIDNFTVTAPAAADGVALGDYLTVAPCSCISQIGSPFVEYIKQYTFALIQQVNGADAQIAYAALNRLEKLVKSMDKGQPTRLRVVQRSHAFGQGTMNNPVPTSRGPL